MCQYMIRPMLFTPLVLKKFKNRGFFIEVNGDIFCFEYNIVVNTVLLDTGVYYVCVFH